MDEVSYDFSTLGSRGIESGQIVIVGEITEMHCSSEARRFQEAKLNDRRPCVRPLQYATQAHREHNAPQPVDNGF